jgi:ribose 5-phosphate isomerase A
MAKANLDDQKKAAALAAFEYIKPGMKLGLGTGSTANFFIEELGRRVKAGLDVKCVPTSKATHELVKSLGIPLTVLEQDPYLDVTVDGADEFDSEFRLIKGGGGALLLEKIVASSSRYMIVIADSSKQVKTLGRFPLPVEVVSFGVKATAWKMQRAFDFLKMKPKMVLRVKDGKPFRTDSGNCIIDCTCDAITDADRLDLMLNNIPGVVNNGLFVGICGTILMGTENGVKTFEKGKKS